MSFGDSVGTPVLGTNTIQVGATAPADPNTGDLWFDTDSNTWQKWSGTAWEVTQAMLPEGTDGQILVNDSGEWDASDVLPT